MTDTLVTATTTASTNTDSGRTTPTPTSTLALTSTSTSTPAAPKRSVEEAAPSQAILSTDMTTDTTTTKTTYDSLVRCSFTHKKRRTAYGSSSSHSNGDTETTIRTKTTDPLQDTLYIYENDVDMDVHQTSSSKGGVLCSLISTSPAKSDHEDGNDEDEDNEEERKKEKETKKGPIALREEINNDYDNDKNDLVYDPSQTQTELSAGVDPMFSSAPSEVSTIEEVSEDPKHNGNDYRNDSDNDDLVYDPTQSQTQTRTQVPLETEEGDTRVVDDSGPVAETDEMMKRPEIESTKDAIHNDDGDSENEKVLPSEDEIREQTTRLYRDWQSGSDKDAGVTVGDMVRRLEVIYHCSIPRHVKKLVKLHLMRLVVESDDEDEDEDDEEERPKKGRRKKANSQSKSKRIRADDAVHQHEEEVEEEKLTAADTAYQPSAEDLARAEAIRSKFETETEEALQSRWEDRQRVLELLQQKKRDAILLRPVVAGDTVSTGQQQQQQQPDSSDRSTPTEMHASSSIASLTTPGPTVTTSLEKEEAMVSLSDSGEASSLGESSDDEDGDDLEIVAAPDLATSLLTAKSLPSFRAKRKEAVDPRVELRRNLRQARIRAGNAWLARELGYANEEEHIRECVALEETRRLQMWRNEEQRQKRVTLQKETALAPFVSFTGTDPATVAEDDGDEGDNDGNNNHRLDFGEEEEDEEQRLAKQILAEQEYAKKHEEREDETFQPTEFKAEADSVVSPENPGENGVPESQGSDPETYSDDDHPSLPITQESESAVVPSDGDSPLSMPKDTKDLSTTKVARTPAIPTEMTTTSSSPTRPTQPRNLAWKALLEKDRERSKKPAGLWSGLVDGEAVEEEDEAEQGGVTKGLEDFGFSVPTSKDKSKGGDNDEDEDYAMPVEEDDLKDVVDDLSDGEGDEELGQTARLERQRAEERERHRAVLRRMREGYDGRRGGIGGGGARGRLRFDQITAADNREDAARLGLLNDDEIEEMKLWEDEQGQGSGGKGPSSLLSLTAQVDDVDDDENLLLDRMLKERFLPSTQRNLHHEEDEEDFSEDEDGNRKSTHDDNDTMDDNHNGNIVTHHDDDEDDEERASRLFTKRARMNRILRRYGSQSSTMSGSASASNSGSYGEFSQSARLLDDETVFSRDLRGDRIKCAFSDRRPRGSQSRSVSGGTGVSRVHHARDRERSRGGSHDHTHTNSHSTPNTRQPLSQKAPSSLSLSLTLARSKRHRKTDFCGTGGNTTSLGRRMTTKSAPSLVSTVSHVLFQHQPQTQTQASSKEGGGGGTEGCRQTPKALRQTRTVPTPTTKKRKSTICSTHANGTTSLWSKVSQNRFGKRVA